MKKDQLIKEFSQSRDEFNALIEGLTTDEMLQPGVTGEWSVKDIMAHLTAWEGELVKLLWQTTQGTTPTTTHFSSTPVDEINRIWHERDTHRTVEFVRSDFEGVRKQTLRRVRALSDQELNNTDWYPWMEGKALWEWIAGDSFDHEREHCNEIEERIQGFRP